MKRLALCCLTILPITVIADTNIPLNAQKLRQLRSGDILHEYVRMEESGGAVQAEVFIQTSVDKVWEILQGCGKAFLFVDGLEQCEIVSRSAENALVHQVVDTGFFAPMLDYSYRSVNQPFSRMEFNLVEGNLRVMQGSWDFESLPDGLLVTYNMRVQPGFPLPRFLVRMSLRRMIPDMLACIRGLVDGSGTTERKQQDLARCPGQA